MSAKHTPGPWAWDPFGARTLYGLAGVEIIHDGGGYEGLRINDYDRSSEEEAAANMAVIAAAPEVLAELQRMVDHGGTWASDRSEEASTETWAALYCAKAAIAKALPLPETGISIGEKQ